MKRTAALWIIVLALMCIQLPAQYDLRFIKTVQFYLDEKPIGPIYAGPFATKTDLDITYILDSKKLSDGPHRLEAIAFDLAGNRYPVAPAKVIVVDNTAPVIAITSNGIPLALGMTLTGKVDITVSASDVGLVQRIELWINGTMVRVSSVAASSTTGATPLVYTWNTSPLKRTSPIVNAVATDKSGNMISKTVQVNIR